MAIGPNSPAGLDWFHFSPLHTTRVAAQWLPSRAGRQATGQPSGVQLTRRH
jgi:hypothetical protein